VGGEHGKRLRCFDDASASDSDACFLDLPNRAIVASDGMDIAAVVHHEWLAHHMLYQEFRLFGEHLILSSDIIFKMLFS
jgi:hypothetical protein